MTLGTDPSGSTVRASGSFGNGAFGVNANANVSTGGSNATAAPGVGTIGVSTGVTVGVSRPRQ
jgi:hypothetical protein